MILIPLAVERDGSRVRITAQHVDVTVDTPGSTQFQEGKGARGDGILEPRLVADGPTGRHGREVTPAVLGGEFRGVEGVRAEVRLDAVTVVIGVSQTAEIGKACRLGGRVAVFLGRIIQHIVQIPEVGLVSLEDVRTGGRTVYIIRFVMDEGRTGHHVETVLPGKDLVVVRKVLPLIVEPCVGFSPEGVCLGVRFTVGVVRCLITVYVALGDAEAEAAGDDQALDRLEIRKQHALDIDASARAVGGVPLYERAAASGFVDGGGGEPAVLVAQETVGVLGSAGQDRLVFIPVILVELAGISPIDRSGRVDGHERLEGGAIALLGNGFGRPLFERDVVSHLKPVRETVIGIQLGGKPLVKILVTPDDTILVDIIERCEIMAVLVTALEGQGVLGTPGRSEVFIEPIRIKTIVIRILQHILDGITLQFLVVDELLGVQHLRLMRKRLKDVFAGIGDGCRSFSALLGGDENHTIARFSAIDGRGSRILEDLHGLDQRRVEILDAADLEAVHNDERSDVAAVGRNTTDLNSSAASRRAGVGDDLDTGHLSLKGGGGI